MKVEKIDHVAILVKDLEKAGNFFANLLGLEFTGPSEHKEADVRSLMSTVGIELVTPLSPNGPVARTLDRRGEGLAGLILKVSSLKEALADMESHGLKPVRRPAAHVAQFHPKDTYGVLIELTE
jgi:methylmalonyl-CoA/ethylmalonyl-CoA epimerase